MNSKDEPQREPIEPEASDLMDQTFFTLSAEAHEQFAAMLETPATPNQRLSRTLHTPPPWREN